MIKVRRIDWSADEWLAGTAILDATERGIYVTIVNMIYSHGGPIPRGWISPAIMRCHGNILNRCLNRLLELGKIVGKGSEITVKRCENELEKARKRTEKWSENGQKGGRPPNKNKGIEKPGGFDDSHTRGTTNYQLPTTNYQL
jgi:uncharacterized protein YdaU (DUF1376 family)